MNHPLNDEITGALKLGGDLRVRRLGFGAMRLTGRGIWGEPADLEGAREVLVRAVRLGVNFIDTADSYGPDVSEQLIGETLFPYPEGLVIATKGGLTRPGPGRWVPNGRPEHLRRACEGSLRRLRLERIDLYQLHRVDPNVPLQESLGALADLRAEGKIRHVGLSNVGVTQLERAQKALPIVSVQNRYNLTDRRSESMVDHCERHGLAFLPWAPIAAGDLAASGGLLDRIAERHRASTGQVALAWLLRRSPAMLPIPGTSSVEHLLENLAAPLVPLTDGEVDELSRHGG
ncbi:MAG TPA: aldo/keto reductase [Actinomycetes bacterium]|nr:aldo/keto reductase [Actinomycetes bacterium]